MIGMLEERKRLEIPVRSITIKELYNNKKKRSDSWSIQPRLQTAKI